MNTLDLTEFFKEINRNIGNLRKDLQTDIKELRGDFDSRISKLDTKVSVIDTKVNEIKADSNCTENTKTVKTLWDEKNTRNGIYKIKETWAERYKAPIITGIIAGLSGSTVTAVIIFVIQNMGKS